MFGFLSAPKCCAAAARSAKASQAAYKAVFCGLSNTLRDEYGLASRWLVNRDAAFVSLLTSSQCADELKLSSRTCCNPMATPRMRADPSQASRFAAAVTVSGLQTKLQDDAADEAGPRRWAASLGESVLSTAFERARATLTASDFPVDRVRRVLSTQSRLEAENRRSRTLDLDSVACPTAEAFGAIFEHTAVLARKEGNRQALHELGFHLGRLVYTLDAFQDYDEDARRGKFNPLLGKDGPAPVAASSASAAAATSPVEAAALLSARTGALASSALLLQQDGSAGSGRSPQERQRAALRALVLPTVDSAVLSMQTAAGRFVPGVARYSDLLHEIAVRGVHRKAAAVLGVSPLRWASTSTSSSSTSSGGGSAAGDRKEGDGSDDGEQKEGSKRKRGLQVTVTRKGRVGADGKKQPDKVVTSKTNKDGPCSNCGDCCNGCDCPCDCFTTTCGRSGTLPKAPVEVDSGCCSCELCGGDTLCGADCACCACECSCF